MSKDGIVNHFLLAHANYGPKASEVVGLVPRLSEREMVQWIEQKVWPLKGEAKEGVLRRY